MSYGDNSEIEASAGIESLDLLLAKHRKLREEFAALWAKYGPGGVVDNLRKMELSRLKEVIRAKAMESGGRMTEAAIDDAAHDHPEYTEFVTTMLKERARYYALDAELRELDWRFQRGQGLLRYVANEPR